MLGSLEVLMDCRGSSMTLVMEGVQLRDRLLLLFPCHALFCSCADVSCGAWMGFLWPVSWIEVASG